MKQQTIKIEGMHCNGCVRTVTNALKNVQGVVNAVVSLPEKKAVVSFDEIEVPFADLRHAVEEAGYTAQEYVPG